MYIHISVNWAVLATLVALVLAQRSPVYENGARKSGKRGIPGGLAGLPPDIAATMPLDSTDRSADLEDQQSIQSGAVVTITETVIVRASSIRAQDSSTVFSTSSVYAMSSSLADQAFEQHTSATSSPVAIDASSCCDTQPLSTSSLLSGPWGSDCPTNPFDKTDMPHYFGLNVVNSKPGDPNDAIKLKQPEDWDAAFALIKQYFGTINAVRIYSTTDGATYHLMNALPAAQKYDLKILAGVWSGGPENLVRFEREKKALRDAITEFGCGNIAAISVGNEDLNQVNVLQTSDPDSVKDQAKEKVAETLISQITQIRNVTRSLGCCNTPITHTDTWNELFDTKRPWLPGLIQACDQAVIANIFPYWGQSSIEESWEMIANQSSRTLAAMMEFNKDVWLGETGWAASQPSDSEPYNIQGTDISKAQDYFDQVGCQILSGSGTGFYYVDWDEDALKQLKPAFGLFDHNGEPKLADLSCSKFKPDMRIKDYGESLPAFMGVSQSSQEGLPSAEYGRTPR